MKRLKLIQAICFVSMISALVACGGEGLESYKKAIDSLPQKPKAECVGTCLDSEKLKAQETAELEQSAETRERMAEKMALKPKNEAPLALLMAGEEDSSKNLKVAAEKTFTKEMAELVTYVKIKNTDVKDNKSIFMFVELGLRDAQPKSFVSEFVKFSGDMESSWGVEMLEVESSNSENKKSIANISVELDCAEASCKAGRILVNRLKDEKLESVAYAFKTDTKTDKVKLVNESEAVEVDKKETAEEVDKPEVEESEVEENIDEIDSLPESQVNAVSPEEAQPTSSESGSADQGYVPQTVDPGTRDQGFVTKVSGKLNKNEDKAFVKKKEVVIMGPPKPKSLVIMGPPTPQEIEKAKSSSSSKSKKKSAWDLFKKKAFK